MSPLKIARQLSQIYLLFSFLRLFPHKGQSFFLFFIILIFLSSQQIIQQQICQLIQGIDLTVRAYPERKSGFYLSFDAKKGEQKYGFFPIERVEINLLSPWGSRRPTLPTTWVYQTIPVIARGSAFGTTNKSLQSKRIASQ